MQVLPELGMTPSSRVRIQTLENNEAKTDDPIETLFEQRQREMRDGVP